MQALFSDRQHIYNSSMGGIEENAFAFSTDGSISGNVSEVKFDGVLIRHCHFKICRPIRFSIETTEPALEMHFALSGQAKVENPGHKKTVVIDSMQHNMVGIPGFVGEYSFMRPDVPVISLEIVFTREFFEGIISEHCSLQCGLLENVDRGVMSLAGKEHLYITPQIQLILQDIIQCKRSGYLKKMFLEAKVLELLMLQTEVIEAGLSHGKQNSPMISKQDTDKVREVKELIDSEPNVSFTLNGLARKVGLNTFKLKKGFRTIYGQTVFGYINDLKMEKARRSLLDGGMTVKEIAYSSGYNSPNNFSTAFKRKYGISPMSLRSNRSFCDAR